MYGFILITHGLLCRMVCEIFLTEWVNGNKCIAVHLAFTEFRLDADFEEVTVFTCKDRARPVISGVTQGGHLFGQAFVWGGFFAEASKTETLQVLPSAPACALFDWESHCTAVVLAAVQRERASAEGSFAPATASRGSAVVRTRGLTDTAGALSRSCQLPPLAMLTLR